MQNVKPYKPTFTLYAEGKNITQKIAEYLQDLSFVDYGTADEEPQADKLTINVVAPDLQLPPKGAKLRLGLGFDSYIVDKGWFIVDSVALSGPPRTITITALAIPYDSSKHKGNMQSQKVRAWTDMTVGDIVKTIATENGLIPKVSPELADRDPGYFDQYNESDAAFLARLARQFGAVSKPTGGYWIFIPEGSGEGPSGKPLPSMTITPDGRTSWQFMHRSKAKTKSKAAASGGSGGQGTVVLTYIDTASGATSTISSGSGEPVMRVGYTYPSRVAAENYLRSRRREESAQESSEGKSSKGKTPARDYLLSMSVAMACTPELLTLTPECKVNTEGFDPQADLEWIVDNIAFRLEPEGGLSVSMELKK